MPAATLFAWWGWCCPIKGAPLRLGETPWLPYGEGKKLVASSVVGGGVRPLSVAPQFESSDVDGSSANGEAFESRVLCFPERFDLS
jgi:hypothetical protein